MSIALKESLFENAETEEDMNDKKHEDNDANKWTE